MRFESCGVQIDDLIAAHDDDNSGALDFAEFVEMLATSSVIMGIESNDQGTVNIAAEISQLRESFTLFDLDCDGVLSFDEIKMVRARC
jgi:Ca2+-binding EF-hand superfamily protein